MRRRLTLLLCCSLFCLATPPVHGGNGEPPPLVYPQLAIGGGFETILQLTNPSSTAWSGTLTVPELAGPEELNWRVNGQDLTGQNQVDLELAPWETRTFSIDRAPGEDSLGASLWITADSQNPSQPASSFFYRYQVEGQLVDEVSTSPAVSSQRVVFPVEIDSGIQLSTGVALRFAPVPQDPAGSGNPAESSFRALLISQQGSLLATADNLNAGAQFLDQVFQYDFGENFLGSLILEADQPFYATALHQRLLEGGRFQLTGVTPVSTQEPGPDTPTALYRVRFEATWSSSTHPLSFPQNAHFSPLVGATHNPDVVFWETGELASNGIRQMAEKGQTGPLNVEVQAAIAAGTADQVLLGTGTGSPGAITLDFSIHRDLPLVTLVSMIAPSPDWFVGVSSLPLFENGAWVDQISVDLRGMDAGTDSGTTYASPDVETQPHVPISELTSSLFLNGGVIHPFGTFTFTRIDNP